MPTRRETVVIGNRYAERLFDGRIVAVVYGPSHYISRWAYRTARNIERGGK